MTPAEILPPAVGSAMVRLRGEHKIAHRAFLLWALGGEVRSIRATCRAIRKPHTTVRDWCRRMEWERRYRETADPDVEAYLVYQSEYLAQCGSAAIVRMAAELVPSMGLLAQLDEAALKLDEAAARERARAGGAKEADEDDDPEEDGTLAPPAPFVPAAPRIAHPRNSPSLDGATQPPKRTRVQADPELIERMAHALGFGAAPTPGAALVPEVVQPSGGGATTPPAPVSASGLTAEEIAKTIRRDIQLVDASLGYFAKRLAAGEIPVRMSDLPILLKVKQLLLGRATANIAVAVESHTASAPVPTVRVQQAKGEDGKYAAYREDIADLATILDGIANGKERDAEIDAVTTGDQRERA